METSQGAQWNTSMFSPGQRQILRLWIIGRPQEGHDGLCSLSADDMETMYPNFNNGACHRRVPTRY